MEISARLKLIKILYFAADCKTMPGRRERGEVRQKRKVESRKWGEERGRGGKRKEVRRKRERKKWKVERRERKVEKGKEKEERRERKEVKKRRIVLAVEGAFDG